MALKKEIVFTNGVNIKYHYISDIQIDGKNKIAKLKVDSYTDETYRQKEKDNKLNQDRYEELINNILQENLKEESKRNVEQIKLWSEEANNLIGKFVDNLDLKVISANFELKDVTDYNESNLYAMLKQNDMFKDSEDI